MVKRHVSRREFLAVAAVGVGTVALAACGGPAASPASGTGAAGGDWQKQWDAMVEGAKKEGRLILATGPSPDARVKVPDAFKKAFGVDVEYLGGSSSELANRLRAEQGSNQYTVDVLISGANTAYINFYGEKMIEPIKPWIINPEALNPSSWTGGKVWYQDPGEEYFIRVATQASPRIVVATDFLSPDIKSWNDLLKPEYKGKAIGIDPTQAGSGGQTGAYAYKFLGEDWFKKFYIDQQPTLTLDDRQLADAVARGKNPIGFDIRIEDLVRLQNDGVKLAVVTPLPEAPGYTSAGFGILGMFKSPPHPNAAHLFLNWIIMKEGQIAWNSAWKTASVRTDVDNSWAPDFSIPKPNLNYFDAYDWEYSRTGWKEINDKIKVLLADRPKG